MPITSVYEDGLVFCMQDDVGSAWQMVDVRLEIISQRRQTTLHRSFRCGVSPSYGSHPSTWSLGAASMGHSDPFVR